MEELNSTPAPEKLVMGNETIESYILESAKWGKFLAIVGYVFMGLMVLFAFVIMFGMSELSKATGTKFPSMLLGLFYLLFTGINFIPITYLYRFSTEAKQAVENNDEEQYTSAFGNLKSLLKFTGIFTIVVLSLYALMIVIAVPMAMILK